MDEGRPPRELIKQKNYILLGIFIMTILFLFVIDSGIYFVGGILIFMLVFSNRNKSETKKELNNSIKYGDNWYVSKYKLSKEIP